MLQTLQFILDSRANFFGTVALMLIVGVFALAAIKNVCDAIKRR